MERRDLKVMVRVGADERHRLETAADGRPLATFLRDVGLQAAHEVLVARAEQASDV